MEALAHRAHGVALGGLDLDDLGAEIGEQPAAERPRDGRADLEDAIAGERTVWRGDGCAGLRGVHGILAAQRM